MSTDLKSAHDVSEYLLEKTGRALMTRDAPLFRSCMSLPQYIETFEGRVLCETPQYLDQIFYSVVDYLRKGGVTELVRHCVAAEFRDPNTVEATHEARLLAGTQVIQPAYPVFSVLKRFEDGWKITYSMYAIADAPGHSEAMIAVPELEEKPLLRAVPQ